MTFTLQFQACIDGDEEKLLLHLKRGTISYNELNSLDDAGHSPLHYAAQYGRTNILRILLDAGAGCVHELFVTHFSQC